MGEYHTFIMGPTMSLSKILRCVLLSKLESNIWIGGSHLQTFLSKVYLELVLLLILQPFGTWESSGSSENKCYTYSIVTIRLPQLQWIAETNFLNETTVGNER